MKIEAKKLSNFFKKFDSINTECILNFDENGLKASTMTPSNIGRLDVTLNKTAFIEYNAIGKIGVQDINILKNITAKFDKEIELIVEGNLLTLKEKGKKVECELISVDFLTECNEMKELDYTDKFDVGSDVIKTFIADANVNKEVNYVLKTTEKSFVLENTGKFKFNNNIEVPECVGGADSKYGELFSQVFANITEDNVRLSLGENFPLKILERSDDMIVSYIIAPIVSDD